MKTLVAAVFTIALAASFSSANACTCGPPVTPEVQYGWSDVIFTGTVALINVSADPDFLDVYFIVQNYWKGSVSVFQKVVTAASDAACGFPFLMNTNYLVYAYDLGTSGDIGTDLCTRTAIPGPGTQADFDYLGPGTPVPVEERTWGAVKSMYAE